MSARPRRSGEDGFTLVFAVALMTLLATLAIALLATTSLEESHSRQAKTVDGSYQAAEAGLNAYMAKLLEDSSFYDHYLIAGEATRTVNGVAYHGSAGADAKLPATFTASVWSYPAKDLWSDPGVVLPGSGFQYDIQVCPPVVAAGQGCGGAFGMGQNPYARIIATGRPVGSIDRRTWAAVELDVKPFSLTDFQMFSRSNVNYGSTATTYGPVYSQGSIDHAGRAEADVMAEGTVSGPDKGISAPHRVYDRNSNPDVRHAPGLATKPDFNNFLGAEDTAKQAAQASGIYLNDAGADAWKLVFTVDGNVAVSRCTKARSGWGWGGYTYYDVAQEQPSCTLQAVRQVPPFGAIYGEQTVIVEGVVHGRVTVLSRNDLVVSGNLTYAGPTDVIGLIGYDDVVIARYAPDVFTWHAAVIAQNGSRHSYSNDGSHAEQDFYGSVTSNGSPSMDMFRVRNYYLDPVLSYIAPPYFPVLNDQLDVVLERQISP